MLFNIMTLVVFVWFFLDMSMKNDVKVLKNSVTVHQSTITLLEQKIDALVKKDQENEATFSQIKSFENTVKLQQHADRVKDASISVLTAKQAELFADYQTALRDHGASEQLLSGLKVK